MKKCAKVFSVILAVMMLASLAACGAEKVKITPHCRPVYRNRGVRNSGFQHHYPQGLGGHHRR